MTADADKTKDLSLSVREICEKYACQHWEAGPAVPMETLISGLAPLSDAGSGFASFLANPKYMSDALSSQATVILCLPEHAERLAPECRSALLVCENPYANFARLSQHFFRPQHGFAGISPQALIDATAEIGADVTVFPNAYVGPGAVVGARSVLYPGSFLGSGSRLGEDVILYPNAVVREGCQLGDGVIVNPGAVIGGDGFGFAPDGDENVKIPQMGGVVLEKHVEVGSNATIDRGTLGDTVIQEQTKIDSLVQIAHNVQVGKACFLAGQSGVAGSSVLGNRVTLAGQVGISGHIKLGDHVVVLAKSGVSKNLLGPGAYNGIPATENREYLRREATLRKLLKERQASK